MVATNDNAASARELAAVDPGDQSSIESALCLVGSSLSRLSGCLVDLVARQFTQGLIVCSVPPGLASPA
jgi:hypothetical protein